MRIGRRFRLAVGLGLVGVLLQISSIGSSLELKTGLPTLFKLRGPTAAPADVVVIGMDTATSMRLHLSPNPEKWPRQVHAQLLDRLKLAGASVVAFDVFFDEQRAHAEDTALAQAIRRSGNVILCKCLWQENRRLGAGKQSGMVIIETGIPPIFELADAALGVAAFPLPRNTSGISHLWTFKTSAGGVPTLPTAVFTAFVLRKIPALADLLPAPDLGSKTDGLANTGPSADQPSLIGEITRLRHLFIDSPDRAHSLMAQAESTAGTGDNPGSIRMLRSLARLFSGPDSLLLNFYGPPGTIPTVSFHDVIDAEKPDASVGGIDLHGKIALVGLSGQTLFAIKDEFYTPFHNDGDTDLNGVEVAATAIDNFIEGRSLSVLPAPASIALVMAWGALIGTLCWILPFNIGFFGLLLAGFLYVSFALHCFSARSLWVPFAVPLLVQLPLGWLIALVDRLQDAVRERKKIRKVFQCYLPIAVVDQLVNEAAGPKKTNRLVHGCCLITDVAGYTAVSEKLPPQELSVLMNEYLKVVFAPVKHHQGIISDVVGDSVMAIWVHSTPRTSSSERACRAALEIQALIDKTRFSPGQIALPTRIGLHSGEILLGTVGADERYAFRALGDIVNTASRIESLNTHLGTRILATEESVEALTGIVCRDVGHFVLVGKSLPVRVFEVMAVESACATWQKELCEAFASALEACRASRWDEALELLDRCTRIRRDDGPTRYYRELCRRYLVQPRMPEWNGQINLAVK